MRILVIGGGAREHALVWKIRQSPLVRGPRDVFCVPGNAGIADLATCLPPPGGGLSDVAALADLAREHRIDLTVVGPELPLTLGLADEFTKRDLPVFGASKAAARIEGSKVFAKEFMARHRIPTAGFEIFSSAREANAWLSSEERSFPIVVKADGLAAGKGVVVAQDRAEASRAVTMMMEQKRFGGAGERIVIEEFLDGVEASIFAVTDGSRMVPLATCQDYKRALDGDRGPNTGGMGGYSPSIELDEALESVVFAKIMKPAVSGLALEGSPYRGVLYAGLMLLRTSDGGLEPRVLEFNARFGDPETEVLMPRIAGDIVPLLASGAAGSLDSGSDTIQWRREWSACVVLASRGYPESTDPGRAIEGLAHAAEVPDTMVFHGATRQAGTAGAIETDGGRILTVTSLGATLREALSRAYAGVDRIKFEGMMCRRDIGKAALARLEDRD